MSFSVVPGLAAILGCCVLQPSSNLAGFLLVLLLLYWLGSWRLVKTVHYLAYCWAVGPGISGSSLSRNAGCAYHRFVWHEAANLNLISLFFSGCTGMLKVSKVGWLWGEGFEVYCVAVGQRGLQRSEETYDFLLCL